ncbi:MAG: D-alanyl-D-alanine carboxypeptidase [Clostridia bacterium]|nr:D-alanyl-D-alanine carboxypeptidase [Clostridia bacterium]
MKFKYCKKLCILILLIILSGLFLPRFSFADESTPQIYCPSALLMDLNSGKILYEKNIDEKKYPASLTKIMTAIIVLENCKLDDVAEVSYNAVMSISTGYVTANLQIGEELTIEQLLYVLMVGSSNDAAVVLAEHVSGSVEEFAKLMNEKAKELGCTNTNFVNPNGEHDENHYSTARDLAAITKYAMKDEKFREIVATTSYKLPTTNKYDKDDRFFTTTNNLIIVNNNSRADNYYYKYAIGIKTGFTTPAGNCLIAAASKGGLELLTVVLEGFQTDEGLSQRYLDTKALFEYGYDTYTLRNVAKSGGIIQTTSIKNATRDTKKLDVVIENDVYVLSKQEDKDSSILPEVTLNDNLKAPIEKGEIIGKVKYTVEGIDYEENLLAANNVKKSHWFIKLILFSFIIFICLLYLDYRKRTRRRKAYKRKKYGGTY